MHQRKRLKSKTLTWLTSLSVDTASERGRYERCWKFGRRGFAVQLIVNEAHSHGELVLRQFPLLRDVAQIPASLLVRWCN